MTERIKIVLDTKFESKTSFKREIFYGSLIFFFNKAGRICIGRHVVVTLPCHDDMATKLKLRLASILLMFDTLSPQHLFKIFFQVKGQNLHSER